MVSIAYLLRFIEEDAPKGDITSDVIIPDVDTRAVIRAEDSGIVAGLTEATALLSHFTVRVTPAKDDGSVVNPGEILLTLEGSAKRILLVERTALNIIGRMSGIATRTRVLGDLVRAKNPACRIAATRKTCPGFGALDKKAVLIGGGDPHRANLSEGFLIKDNHLALVPIPEAIRRAKAYSAYKKVEVEVESGDDALLAAESGADIIMLDNMTPGQVADTLVLLKKAGLRDRVTIEVSGGIDEKTLVGYAASGADIISMGSLTHTVRNFSVTLEIFPQ
ncbi:MAG TPA: carboxylating nicotinate-nucleotide diphosphorylase [Methanoregula sp.]|nr:carboxylating nicotinate-nucleotide diphosphorylase [Methanoregula sp.]